VAAGIVGQADLTLGRRAESVLIALMHAGGDRFRGIRHITAWDADTSLNSPAYPAGPGLLGDRTFREGFALLGEHGLLSDAWLYHPQIGELANLAGTFSSTQIVLNHCGGPIGSGAHQGKRDEVLPKWQASIKALAAHPNVFVKIGGLAPSSELLANTC
jgi:predicted TIM-barrel fold metal-dependent hydrolase